MNDLFARTTWRGDIIYEHILNNAVNGIVKLELNGDLIDVPINDFVEVLIDGGSVLMKRVSYKGAEDSHFICITGDDVLKVVDYSKIGITYSRKRRNGYDDKTLVSIHG